MKKSFLLASLFLSFAFAAYAQSAKPSFTEKNNQHTIDADALSLSYSYAHRFNPKLILGARINAGFSFRYMLTNPMYYYNCDQCDAPDWQRVKASSPGYFDLLKFQLFYRYPLSKHFYLDGGLYASVGLLNFELGGGYTAGMEASAF